MRIVYNRGGLPRLIHVSSEEDVARLQDSILDVAVALDTPLIMVLEKLYFDSFDILFLFPMLSSDLAERIWTESHNKHDAMAIK